LTNGEVNAADVFRRFGLGHTGFWNSVAVPPLDDARPGAKLRLAFELLGGVYLAFARFLLWRADLLEVDILNALRQITDSIPPVPRDKVLALLQHELGSEKSHDLAWQMESEPVWSTLSRTAYLSWYHGVLVVVQVAREPIPESALAEFEAGIRFLGHPDIACVTAPRILEEFRIWLRHAETPALERSYLEVLGRSRGETLVDYPELIAGISTDQVLCWPWIEGEPVGSLVRRGSVETVTKVALAVLEQFYSLSIVDADLQPDAIVMPTGGQRLVVRRINRPLAVPPPAVNLGMKYIAAVLEGNASMIVQTLLTLAVGQSTANLEADLLNLMSGIEPELKVHSWYPGSASAFESNWRALAKLEVSRARPLFVDCLHRNLIAIGYWAADAVSAGGKATDPITEAQWPVLERVLRVNAAQFLNPGVVTEWSVGAGLLTFGAMREANRLAEEFRETNLTMEVQMPEADAGQRPANSGRGRRAFRMSLVAGFLLITLLVALRWGSDLGQPAASFMMTVAIGALVGLFWVVAKIS
jgi:hypothetical protein